MGTYNEARPLGRVQAVPMRAVKEWRIESTSQAGLIYNDMPAVTDEMIGRVVCTVEYNTEDGGPNAIDAAQRVHLCANSPCPAETVNRAIVAALERGDPVEQENGYVPAEPETYRRYIKTAAQ